MGFPETDGGLVMRKPRVCSSLLYIRTAIKIAWHKYELHRVSVRSSNASMAKQGQGQLKQEYVPSSQHGTGIHCNLVQSMGHTSISVPNVWPLDLSEMRIRHLDQEIPEDEVIDHCRKVCFVLDIPEYPAPA